MSDEERDRRLDERLAGAPREAEPARDLWPAVARAITGGQGDASGAGPPTPIRRRRWVRSRAPLQVAAALALFAGGVLVGQRWEGTDPAPTVPAPDSAFDAAAEVQRAGTEYVGALARLDETAGTIERDQGVDAALSTLQGAAYELVRLRPDDPQAGRILYTVSEARLDGDGDPPPVRF